jgi:glycosyltransferase involved in cell wall biosynthesis
MSAPALHVGYLVNIYPAVSQTFIRREILALERCGARVTRFALRGWNDVLPDEDDRIEQAQTIYVLQRGALKLAAEIVLQFFTSPLQLLRAFALALRLARASDRSVAVHLAYLAEACFLRRRATELKLDHLHAHFATNPAAVGLLTRTLGGPPFSFTAHGSDIMDRPAQVGLAEKVGGASFGAAVCSFGRTQIFRWIPTALWDKVKVVRCGLEPGYGAGSTPPKARQRAIVCVGRLAPEKGQLLLIQAICRMKARGIRVEATLVGDGPLRGEIERSIAASNLLDQVRLTGSLDAAGVRRELLAARALVVSSLSEGLPIVIMEAMAHRRPVIAPFLAGIPELVSSERTGWLYPASDVDALCCAIQACLDATEHQLAVMGDEACRQVWLSHDVDVQARNLLELMMNSAVG